jgi:hypothetical protein
MEFKPTEETCAGPRYDAETLRQVTALAHQLQESHREALTAGEIEAIGEEVGLGRAFVRDALKQLALQKSQGLARHDREQEFRDLAGGWALGALGSLAAWLAATAAPGAGYVFTLVSPPLLAVAIGFLIGKKRAAVSAGTALALALALVWGLAADPAHASWRAVFAYLTAAGPLAAWLAWHGARLREHYFPRATGPAGVSSPALLDLLVQVQRQLDERAEHRAFLSVGVARAGAIRRDAPEALAAHSFAQFREWAEGLVRECGGECRAAGDDGLTGIFPTDEGAVSAARRLQEGMDRFNADRNRLATPFRARCGLTAGRVAGGGEQPPDPLQAAFIERAAELQRQADPGDILLSGELAAAGLLELRLLAPLDREAGKDPVFSWRAGQRAHQRP